MRGSSAAELNPTGRLDVLALRLLEAYVERSGSGELKAWFGQARPVLAEVTEAVLAGIDTERLVERARLLQRVAPIRRAER